MPRRTAVAYLRTSTAEQRNGLEAQEHAIREWAAREGVEVVLWCRDVGVSGGAPLDRRPGLAEALAALPELDLLVVHKRDRLCRDVAVGVVVEREAERVGAGVVSTLGEGTGDSPEARLMRRLFDAVARQSRTPDAAGGSLTRVARIRRLGVASRCRGRH
jgi:DNA invertase Pin-like site-specific DNA recombinase